jgi:Tfp pilus assembly PilM family ATPase
MPNLIALEWDHREIRIVSASGKGRQVVIEHAFSIPSGEGGAADPQAANLTKQIGQKIAAALESHNLAKCEAVVAVGRSSIELRQLQLPPAPDDDLPELVRFQAPREFNEFDDKWLLDFVSIDGSPAGPRNVLAMAIGPAVIKQIETVCEAAGVKMRRLVLRPCEAAALVANDKSIPRGKVVMLVDPLGFEADLTVIVDGQAVFLRTTRLAGDPPPLPALLAEIRLTMAAAANQLGGRKIESILICGTEVRHAELSTQLQTELGIAVERFDPFTGITLGGSLTTDPPQHSGRYAPLLGMLLTELKPAQHAIDFLHPRRRPDPPDPRRKWILAASVGGALLLSYLIYQRAEHSWLAGEVDAMQKESDSLVKEVEAAKKLHANVAEVATWADEDVVWLDRLQQLNQNFPTAENAALNQLTLTATKRGGQIDLKGFVRRTDVIAAMEDSLNDRVGKMTIKNSREDRSVSPYTWAFEGTVAIDPTATAAMNAAAAAPPPSISAGTKSLGVKASPVSSAAKPAPATSPSVPAKEAKR